MSRGIREVEQNVGVARAIERAPARQITATQLDASGFGDLRVHTHVLAVQLDRTRTVPITHRERITPLPRAAHVHDSIRDATTKPARHTVTPRCAHDRARSIDASVSTRTTSRDVFAYPPLAAGHSTANASSAAARSNTIVGTGSG